MKKGDFFPLSLATPRPTAWVPGEGKGEGDFINFCFSTFRAFSLTPDAAHLPSDFYRKPEFLSP